MMQILYRATMLWNRCSKDLGNWHWAPTWAPHCAVGLVAGTAYNQYGAHVPTLQPILFSYRNLRLFSFFATRFILFKLTKLYMQVQTNVLGLSTVIGFVVLIWKHDEPQLFCLVLLLASYYSVWNKPRNQSFTKHTQ